jgi:hypothetical protein
MALMLKTLRRITSAATNKAQARITAPPKTENQ